MPAQIRNRREPLKKIATFLSLAALGMAAPAFAQDTAPQAAPQAPAAQAAAAKAGDTVYDTAGEAVGTVESVNGDNFVLSTGAKKATLPMNALANGPHGLTIGVTKAELDAAIQKAGG
jgi:hypothetical protein